jgi:hypothetical protein
MGLGSGIGDSRSGIRKKPLPDPEKTFTGSRIWVRDTAKTKGYNYFVWMLSRITAAMK